MKKKILIILPGLLLLFLVFGVSARAADGNSQKAGAGDVIGQVKQELSAIFENVDEETAKEVFSFLKEKISDGNLSSEEGLLNAIREGKEKFGVEIAKDDARKLVDTMNKLEGMGFSAEDVLDKTESLYQEYGADFVEHVDEILTGAVKNAASNAVGSFFGNLKESVKNFFVSLFS
ncbi:DUF1002 domain-containing protein [Parablautia muri]|nr:DUF1002 domain-containing protein [Parablautia muri]